MASVLVIDDEQSICWGLTKLGQSMGHHVRSAASALQGIELAQAAPPDVLVLDVRLPGIDGLEAMHRFREITDAPIIVITAFGDMRTAMTAVKNGAFEYLLKPFDLKDARVAIERALTQQPTVETGTNLANQEMMVGDSPAMQSLYRQIALAADSRANVLLRGESGTGKELAARAIHRHSSLEDEPFVPVNVAALGGSPAESELHGYLREAFTAADRTRQSVLHRASGGTLFLDEVSEIPLPTQVHLLQAIEEQQIAPASAGDSTPKPFRVIAATHQDLKRLVHAGAFRRDLYYRICGFEIRLPALRDRPQDIAPLAVYLAAHLGEAQNSFAEETLAELRNRKWFGNVRELRNAVEHALVLARSGLILPEHLPPPEPLLETHNEDETDWESTLADSARRRMDDLLDDPSTTGAIYERLLHELEQAALPRALERFNYEYAPAARALGLHRTTLRKKIDSPPQPE